MIQDVQYCLCVFGTFCGSNQALPPRKRTSLLCIAANSVVMPEEDVLVGSNGETVNIQVPFAGGDAEDVFV